MAEIDLIKISELPATSTIGDADELAVVQGGATKKVPYSVLKAGAEVTPDTTLSEAGVPADAAAVGAALALKANQAAVTQALAAKADKTEVTDISGDIAELASVVETKADQTALNQKADKTTTDALRQDLTTLNGIVNQKADKTELNTQIGNVTAELATKANTADVNNLLAAKANVASPVFTGRPQAPTAAKGTATLQLATTAFVQNAIDDKQDTLTFDAAPTENSTNPVTSGGVYTALEDAKDAAEMAIGEVREESEEATAEAKEIALKAFATPTASGQLITLTDGSDGIPAKTLTLTLAPHQSGSGDPSPENVRPISGYDSVKVVRTGKNILENNASRSTSADFTFTKNEDGTLTLNGTSTVNRIVVYNFAFDAAAGTQNDQKKHIPNGDWIASSGAEDNGIYLQISQSNDATVAVTQTLETPFTVTDQYQYNWIRLYVRAGTYENVVVKPMIHSASFADAAYEPYTGESYTITIPTAAGTVYGGSLEINEDGTGTLTVDHVFYTISGQYTVNKHTLASFDGYYIELSRNGLPKCASKQDGTVGQFNMFRLGNLSDGNNCAFVGADTIQFRKDGGGTGEEMKTWFASYPLQVVYPLAEPTTYTLTASQVTTLLGDNTLWMDADGSIDLVYRADTQKYIDSRIALLNANLAYIEDGTTASRAYSVGQYVLIGGQLYKVTSSIASGATFTIGTNVVATTVGNELTALN